MNNYPLEALREVWKPVTMGGIDYTGLYEVSNLGRVRSLKRMKGRIMKLCNDGRYLRIGLTKHSKQLTYSVHVLVCSIFINVPQKGLFVHHEYARWCNRADCLGILTPRQNNSIEKVAKSGLPCGVSLTPRNFNGKYINKYCSKIGLNQKAMHLGRYKTEEQASNAYKIALKVVDSGIIITRDSITIPIDAYRLSIGEKKLRLFNKSKF